MIIIYRSTKFYVNQNSRDDLVNQDITAIPIVSLFKINHLDSRIRLSSYPFQTHHLCQLQFLSSPD